MDLPATRERDRGVAMVFRRFYPEYGGPGIAIWRLAPRLAAAGYRLRVLCRFLPGQPRESRIEGVAVRRCGGPGRLGELRFIFGVLARLVVERGRYSRIHVFHAGWLTFLVPLLGRLLGRPATFTMTLLESDDPTGVSRMTGPALKLWLFRLYDRYIHINPEQASSFLEVYGEDSRLIPGSMGIDFETFAPPSASRRLAARVELNLDPDASIAAFSGAVIRRKGIDRAVEIWMELARVRPGATLVVVGPIASKKGDGDEFIYDALSRRIEAAGLQDRFRFLGETREVSEVVRVLHAADLLLFPSRNEGTPSAVLEAMGCEVVPVIAGLPGFAGVVVRDGSEGLVIGDDELPAATAARIGDLLDDAPRRTRMAAAARARAEELHSEQVAVEALQRAWHDPRIQADAQRERGAA